MLDFSSTGEMWMWAHAHPYLFTVIKLGTPSVFAVILYVASRIVANVLGGRRR
jgi:hypothetical protein